MDAREFLRSKRDRRAHAPADIVAFVDGFVHDAIPDYQVSAWLMAAFLNGLNEDETRALTGALLHSGRVFDWSRLDRPSADKHSTGGVGDKISLPLAPLVAACGVNVPMVSGRGLGHTGGTLDKLESIPGFTTRLEPEAMAAQLERIGVIMVGQGRDLAPADGRLYALRDVTATVEFEPFIVSSIVSKKLAEGAQAVVYDVKCGGGAFMKERARAAALGRRLVATTRAMGRRAVALVTDMSQPLGRASGNALEVVESAEILKGKGPPDVRALTLDLAAEMLALSGGESDRATARARAERCLDSGAAWERFLDLVAAQGGDPEAVSKPGGWTCAPRIVPVTAAADGLVSAIDTYRLGELVVRIGGGRRAKEDSIDPRVGFVIHHRIGDRVARGDLLLDLHLSGDDPGAVAEAGRCFTIGDSASPPDLVIERID